MSRRSTIILLVTALIAAASLAPALAAPSPAEAPPAPKVRQEYVDVAPTSGLGGFLHAGFLGNSTSFAAFVEFMGPGTCWLDADGDGLLDLYLVNGRYHSQPEKELERQPMSRLYRNLGGGLFGDVTAATGVGLRAWGQGCAVADYDNDGDPDLFVGGWASDTLYRNDGGVFTNVTTAMGVQSAGCAPHACWSSSATWFDADRDGCMDLHVSRFGNWSFSVPGPSGPELAPGQLDRFFHGGCGAPFVESAAAAGFNTYSNTWAAVAYDINNDLWPDLYVANDGDPNELWINDGDGTFTHVVSGAENDRAGMGAAVGDLDHDGRPDLVTTNFMNQANGIFLQNADGTFRDVGENAPWNDARPYVGWAAFMSDIDHNGRQDLTVVNGFTEDISSALPAGLPLANTALFYGQDTNGVFRPINATLGPGALAKYVGRGASWADYDNDGDLDMSLAEAGEAPTHLLRSDRPAGNHLTVDLVGNAPGVTRDAEGARVTVSAPELATLSKEKRAQQGFLSSNDPRVHFGLGDARAVQVHVRWPDGSTQTFADVRANSFVRIVQGQPLIVLRELPLGTYTGPSFVERLVPATFSASLDVPLARAEWDLGDGAYVVCADGVCLDEAGAVVGSMAGTTAEITHAFSAAGDFDTAVALIDASGHATAKRLLGTVTSKVVASLAFDRERFDMDETASGVAHAHYEDGTPVSGVRMKVDINYSFYPQPESVILPLTPAGVRTLLGYRTVTLEGTTDAQGAWRFTVPLWVQGPIPAVSSVKFNPPGDYHALASGTYRSSVLVNGTASYQVFPVGFGAE